MHLSRVLSDYLMRKVGVTMLAGRQYQITVDLFDAWRGSPVEIETIDIDAVAGFMRHLLTRGRSGRTVNNKRAHVITLWRHAFKRGFTEAMPPQPDELPKVPEVRRVPTAWSIEQMEILLEACLAAKPRVHSRNGKAWTGNHWAAIVSTAYDTCRRIGALLAARRDDLNIRDGVLFIRGEDEKGRVDSLTSVSDRSVALIRRLPESVMLFDWPYADRIQKYYESDVLRPAGLPHGRRDKFHRVRRTSYTYVAKSLGIAAASEHASHKSDLSRSYLDTTKLDRPLPITVLPELKCG